MLIRKIMFLTIIPILLVSFLQSKKYEVWLPEKIIASKSLDSVDQLACPIEAIKFEGKNIYVWGAGDEYYIKNQFNIISKNPLTYKLKFPPRINFVTSKSVTDFSREEYSKCQYFIIIKEENTSLTLIVECPEKTKSDTVLFNQEYIKRIDKENVELLRYFW